MKKFVTITPLQPVKPNDMLRQSHYEPVGNPKLEYAPLTRFPIIPLINAYAEEGEEIQVIAVTAQTEVAYVHLEQLREELATLKESKGFVCEDVVEVSIPYAGDVNTQISIFHSLLDYFASGDQLYACLTYGNKPMPIAELMAVQYAYRVLENVSIECLVYGEVDHSVKPSPMRIFDITALVQLDEIVRMLADMRVEEPKQFIDNLLKL